MRNRSYAACALVVMLGLADVSTGCAARGSAALETPALLDETAPATYTVKFETSAGGFVVAVHRDWAPHGADPFYNLVKKGF